MGKDPETRRQRLRRARFVLAEDGQGQQQPLGAGGRGRAAGISGRRYVARPRIRGTAVRTSAGGGQEKGDDRLAKAPTRDARSVERAWIDQGVAGWPLASDQWIL